MDKKNMRYLLRCIKKYDLNKESKNELIEQINKIPITEEEKVKMFKDYKKAYVRYHIDFPEYMQYGFFNLKENERNEFISVNDMRSIYKRYGLPEVREIFRNKQIFLEKFDKYIKRKWMLIDENTDVNELTILLNSGDCMIKQLYGSRGVGGSKLEKGTSAEKIISQYSKSGAIVEECVRGNKEIQAFHPNSLNTIRVVTFSNGDKKEVFGAFLRTGRNGSSIDNAHAGGIFAQINIETGIIESDGINSDGEMFKVHPYSNLQFKGFKIPLWKEIKELCLEACSTIPNIKFAGWDVTINDNNELQLIEGNHAPDFDVMQSPLKVGVKKKVYKILKEIDIM